MCDVYGATVTEALNFCDIYGSYDSNAYTGNIYIYIDIHTYIHTYHSYNIDSCSQKICNL